MSEQSNHPTPTQSPEDVRAALSDKRRTALLRYMAILFGVAFLLVLLSFLIQMRDSRETISDLHQSNASALQNAGKLQEENQALTAENEQLRLQLENQTDALAEAQSEQERLDSERISLETQLAEAQQSAVDTQIAYDLLLQAQDAADREDLEGLTALLEQLAPLEAHLSDTAQEQLTILRGLLTAESA